jgi:acyl-coenzyme A thioesterase PaaI-like protein
MPASCHHPPVTTNDSAASYDAGLMGAVADLATALRNLIEVTVVTTVGADEVRAAAELVRAATPALGAARRPASQLPSLDDPAAGRPVYNPVSGIGSPLAPPLAIRRVEGGRLGEVTAEATLGVAYEGPASYLHGGMSALFMDQLLGAAAGAAGLWGMTARLELDYRRPVPLETRLLMRAAVTENTGRKTVLTGTIATAAAAEQTLSKPAGSSCSPGRNSWPPTSDRSPTQPAGTRRPAGPATPPPPRRTDRRSCTLPTVRRVTARNRRRRGPSHPKAACST